MISKSYQSKRSTYLIKQKLQTAKWYQLVLAGKYLLAIITVSHLTAENNEFFLENIS